jgi:hypothetical protein
MHFFGQVLGPADLARGQRLGGVGLDNPRLLVAPRLGTAARNASVPILVPYLCFRPARRSPMMCWLSVRSCLVAPNSQRTAREKKPCSAVLTSPALPKRTLASSPAPCVACLNCPRVISVPWFDASALRRPCSPYGGRSVRRSTGLLAADDVAVVAGGRLLRRCRGPALGELQGPGIGGVDEGLERRLQGLPVQRPAPAMLGTARCRRSPAPGSTSRPRSPASRSWRRAAARRFGAGRPAARPDRQT